MKLNEINTPYFANRPKGLDDGQKYPVSSLYYMVSNVRAHRYSVIGTISKIIKGKDVSEAQAVNYWNRKVQQHLRKTFPTVSRVDATGLRTQLFQNSMDRNNAILSSTIHNL